MATFSKKNQIKANINSNKKTKLMVFSTSLIVVVIITGLFFFKPASNQQIYSQALTAFKTEKYEDFKTKYNLLANKDSLQALLLDQELLKVIKQRLDIEVTPYLENGINYYNRAISATTFITNPAFKNQIENYNYLIADYNLLKQANEYIVSENYQSAFITANQINYPDLILKTKLSLFFAKNQTYLGGELFKKMVLEQANIEDYQLQLNNYLSLVTDEVQYSFGRDLLVMLMYQGQIKTSNDFVNKLSVFYDSDEIKEFNNLIEKTSNYYANPDANEVKRKTEKSFVRIEAGGDLKPGVFISLTGLILTDQSMLELGKYYLVKTFDNRTVQAQVISVDPLLNAALLYAPTTVPDYVKLGNSAYTVKEKVIFLNNQANDYSLVTSQVEMPYVFNGSGVFTQLNSNETMLPGNPVFDRFGNLIGLTTLVKIDEKNAIKPIYQFKNFILQTDTLISFKPYTFDWFDNLNLEMIRKATQYDGLFYSDYDSFYGLLDSKHLPIFGTYSFGQVQNIFFGEFDYLGLPDYGLYIWDQNSQYYGSKIQKGIKTYGELYGGSFGYIGEFQLNVNPARDNNLNGVGYYFTENNNVFYGSHQEDERVGLGETFFYDGSYYRGIYTNTCNADGFYYYITGQIEYLPYRECKWG